MAENEESAVLAELQAELAAKPEEGKKKRRKPNKHTEMKAKSVAAKRKETKVKAAAAKHKEMKAKAAAANIPSKQKIASAFQTPSPAAKDSVCAQ